MNNVIEALETCGDNSCAFGAPKGAGTNGGCRCGASQLRCGVVLLRRELAKAHAAKPSELERAERELVEETLAWQAYDRSRPLKDPGFTTVPFVRWMSAVDRVIALRAAQKESE